MADKRFQDTLKLTDPKTEHIHYIAKRAMTGTRVKTLVWYQSPVMQDEAGWYKWPACHGVHLNLMRRDEPGLGKI